MNDTRPTASTLDRMYSDFVYLMKSYRSFLRWLFSRGYPWKETGRQFFLVFDSAIVQVIAGSIMFSLLLTWVSGYYGRYLGAARYVSTATVEVILRAGSVMLASTIYSAKVGTAMTVEIGSMQMTGQLDALKLMDIEPFKYLVIPRVAASLLVLPIFVGITHGIAILSSAFLLQWWFDLPIPIFLDNAFVFLDATVITSSMLRAVLIGFFVSLNACCFGTFYCDSAADMGETTTKALVLNIFVVLITDLLVSVGLRQGGFL
ncbi:MAG: ABC transporter permease [Spirochaeta sp.]|nr:ABC transporter permease [Spirochaeta sp.]